MAILDFFPGRRHRRKHAAALAEIVSGPFDRLHAMIEEAGVAALGDGFEPLRTRFVDCRIMRTEQLADFPAADREALYKLVNALLPGVRPLHAEVKAAFEQVRRDWTHGGLVEAAAGGGLRALDALQEQPAPKTAHNRLMRIVHFLDVAVAASDVQGELRHLAEAPSLFW